LATPALTRRVAGAVVAAPLTLAAGKRVTGGYVPGTEMEEAKP